MQYDPRQVANVLLQPNPMFKLYGWIGGQVEANVKRGATLEDNTFSDWLYGEYDEEKYKKYLLLHAVPGVSQYMDYLLDYRVSREYLDRYGMDWTDIHDPRKLALSNSGTALARFGMNFVSKNVDKLYR